MFINQFIRQTRSRKTVHTHTYIHTDSLKGKCKKSSFHKISFHMIYFQIVSADFQPKLQPHEQNNKK